MSEDIKREETPRTEETPLDEKVLEDAAGGVVKAPHTRNPREYESVGG